MFNITEKIADLIPLSSTAIRIVLLTLDHWGQMQ